MSGAPPYVGDDDTHLFCQRNALRHCQFAALKWGPNANLVLQAHLFGAPSSILISQPSYFLVCSVCKKEMRRIERMHRAICVLFNLFISLLILVCLCSTTMYSRMVCLFATLRRRMWCGFVCVCAF